MRVSRLFSRVLVWGSGVEDGFIMHEVRGTIMQYKGLENSNRVVAHSTCYHPITWAPYAFSCFEATIFSRTHQNSDYRSCKEPLKGAL